MMNTRSVLFAGLLTCFAAMSSHGQATNGPAQPAVVPRTPHFSALGDPAPALTVAEWIKGKPVKIQPGTNIYAVVLCSLSRANEFALTNLSALQRKYADRGLIVAVISDDPPAQLKDCVLAKGAEIDFTVAADDLGRKTTSDYQQTFRQWMLPRAYLVGTNGNVLWFGHPLRDGMDDMVNVILSGQYNVEQTTKQIVSKEQLEGYLSLAREDDARTGKAGRMLLAVRTNDVSALCELAFDIATDPQIEKRDFEVANAALDRAEQLSGANATNATDIAVDRAILLFQAGKQADGLAVARKALDTAKTAPDRSEVNTCIRAMEARIAAEKIAQTNAAAVKP